MEKETIIQRLESFGYKYDENTDTFFLDFAIEKGTNHILNKINCSEIPKGLIQIAIDMICAEFLQLKKGFNQLTDFDFEQIAQSIKLGDTSIQFSDDATPEEKFNSIINHLLSGYEEDFIRYRKMVW